jgi:shikimate dehydrogenase
VAAGPPERLTRLAAVLGSPIRHSLSPVLHAAAYAELGLDWSYTAHEVDEAGLRGFVESLDARWVGLSLTMPLKRAAILLCDEISARARAVSAVNTVTFGADGRRRGDNTDIPGLVGALRSHGVEGVSSAAILGGGATAASALAALAQIAAGPVTVYVRGADRARQMTDLAGLLGVAVVTRDWADAAAALAEPLVVATTPKGAADALVDAVPRTPGVLFDVVYDPWPTPLAAAWTAGGGQVVGGLELLVHQAALQVELMTGQALDLPPIVAVMRAAGEAVLAERAAARR